MTSFFRVGLLVFGAYYVLGKLGQALVIPPGFDVVIWPTASVALVCVLFFGYRVLPSVFLAAFLLQSSVVSGGVVGFGAVVTAALGAFLTRRFIGWPFELRNRWDILKFYILTGVGSSFVLAFFGSIVEGVSRFWVIWFGEMLAMVVYVPSILFVLFSARVVRPGRRVLVVLPIMVFFLFGIGVYQFTNFVQIQKYEEKFALELDVAEKLVYSSLEPFLRTLNGIERFFYSSEMVTREEFRDFTAFKLGSYEGIQAFEWIPVVYGHERVAYKVEAYLDGYRDFYIGRIDEQGRYVQDIMRDTYYPVFYVEPVEGNLRVMGYNLGSNEQRLKALEKARDLGVMVASEPVDLVQVKEGQKGFLIFYPVYENGKLVDTVNRRREALQGFVLGVFRVEDVLAPLFDYLNQEGLSMRLTDVTDSSEGKLFFDSKRGQSHFLSETLVLDITNRKWAFTFFTEPLFVFKNRILYLRMVQYMGVLIMWLLGFFLLYILRRAYDVQEVVDQRTQELKVLLGKYEQSNEELERFAYVASHDLKEPIQMISSFSQLLEERAADRLDKKERKYVEVIHSSSARMYELINDLLEYSRVRSLELEKRELVDMRELVQKVTGNLRYQIKEAQGVVTMDDVLPPVESNHFQMEQLLQNLVSNAIKYSKLDERPEVHVGFEDGVYFVRDNGIGMNQENLEQIFEPFKRLHASEDYSGTGVGLSICEKIVTSMGGRIWAESTLGEGTVFYFTIPDEDDVSGS